MIKKCIAILLVLLTYSGVSVYAANIPLNPSPEQDLSAVLVAKLVKQFHYKENSLDDAESKAILHQYLESLDPGHSIFTLEDIASFNRYATVLDDSLRKGDLEPAFAIYRLFNQRGIERADYALERLEKPFDFSLDEEYLFDRTDATWAKDKNELDEIWRKRVKNDVLSLSLANKSDDEIKKTLRKRYQRYITRSEQNKPEDVYDIFINAYLKTLDPHSDYFSPRGSENFKINMSLSLEGVGAVLKSDGDYIVIQSTVPGGPAELSGQLHPGDRISGVGQGGDGLIEDVVGWRIDDVVALIRGPKDSVVRLQILPKESGPDGPAKVVTIIRDKIKLEKQQVKKSVIEVTNGDHTSRIGVISVPTFYMDFDAARRGEKDYVSTTRDTRNILEELKADQVDGIVIDLTGNGGGSLMEAISMTGLFIKSGPVVQVLNSNNKLEIDKDTDDSIAYTGPMAVLVNRFSASASEIFAGAMQDYGRAPILGEPTFGKGTVQQIYDLNRYLSHDDVTLGQLKLTTAQFFRINGDSTQNRGVIPDIIFPAADVSSKQGEKSLENALPWAHIAAASFVPAAHVTADLAAIKKMHENRIQSNSGFQYLLGQAEMRNEILDQKSVTLRKTLRKAEREKRESERLEIINRFRLSQGLEPEKKSDLNEDDDMSDSEDDKFTEEVKLIQPRESAAILVDLINQAQIQDMPVHRTIADVAH